MPNLSGKITFPHFFIIPNLKKFSNYILLFWIGTLALTSCSLFTAGESKEYVARVHDTYLERKEVERAIPKNLSKEDSLIFANNFINRWATNQLLLEGAKINLPQEKQEEFALMVNEYRRILYSEAYKDLIIASKMDTVISDAEIEEYFEQNENNFKLNETLVKVRYIALDLDYGQINELKKQFRRYNDLDREELENEAIKFDNYSLNDSIWVKARDLEKRIPLLKDQNSTDYLKKDKFTELSDSLSLYLIIIKDIRTTGDQAPLSYIKPTIKQILLNKRKLKFEKYFKKDITKDALENHTFEIFE